MTAKKRLAWLPAALACGLPVLAASEQLVRGPAHHLVVKDFLCPACYAPIMGMIVAVALPVYHARRAFATHYPWLLVAAVLLLAAGAYLARYRGRQGQRLFHGARRRATTSALVCVGAILWFCWFSLCAWVPAAAVACEAVTLVLLYALRRARPIGPLVLLSAVLVPGSCLFGLAHAAEWLLARTAPEQCVARLTAYNGAVDLHGWTLALGRTRSFLYDASRGQWEALDGVSYPQHYAYDRRRDRILIANAGSYGLRLLTVLARNARRDIDAAGCTHPIGVDLDEAGRSLLVTCELSNKVLALDLDTFAVRHQWRNIPWPYAISVDPARSRAWVATEPGLVYVIALDRPEDRPRVCLPAVNAWNIRADPEDGSAWVALGVLGEVVNLQPDCRISGRFRAGWGARDLAIDSKRHELLVSNYFSGTLSVFDLRRRRLSREVRVGPFRLFQRLSGIGVMPDGSWVAANISGVWKIHPD